MVVCNPFIHVGFGDFRDAEPTGRDRRFRMAHVTLATVVSPRADRQSAEFAMTVFVD